MLSGILSPAFLQAACAKKQAGGNVITLIGVKEDPTIYGLSCTGDITIKSVKNGAPVVETYSNLSETQVTIQADADTTVIIRGDVTKYTAGQYQGWGYADGVCAKQLVFNNSAITSILGVSGVSSYGDTSVVSLLDVNGCIALTTLNCSYCSALTALDLSKNTALTELVCSGCSALTALDMSKNTALTTLDCSSCSVLTAIDLSKNTALTTLWCGSCSALTALDVSKNTALTELGCSGCSKLVSISYPATNEDVATAIAGAITEADAADGTVYTDSAGAYYSTIETAATTKGWTIEQLA